MTDATIAATGLEALETNTKQEFLRHLASLDRESIRDLDIQTFARIVRLAHLFMAAGDFCSEFGITRGTLSRWRTAVAVPIPYLRQKVVEFVRQRLEEVPAIT